MRRLMAFLLCVVLTAALLAGCGGASVPENTTAAQTSAAETSAAVTEPAADTTPAESASEAGTSAAETEPGTSAAEPATSEVELSSSEPAPPETEPTSKAEPELAFTFQPKVTNSFIREIFGEQMVQAFYNLVDAVYAGEDEFECYDQFTYDWMIGQFPDRCFPLLCEIIESDNAPVQDGIGHIFYKFSPEETKARLAEWEKYIEDLVNRAMKPGWSDLENALSLYVYFCDNYEYDYETYGKMSEESVDYIWSYRFLTEGKGICQEISSAYSYLLMQAGIDATIMMGTRADGEGHQWSYVQMNGHYYHIDPTYVLGSNDSLEYFMMTDEQRKANDYPRETYVIASCYTQDHDHPDYRAEDDTYSPLWGTFFDSFDPDADIIYCHSYDYGDTVKTEEKTFEYGGT